MNLMIILIICGLIMTILSIMSASYIKRIRDKLKLIEKIADTANLNKDNKIDIHITMEQCPECKTNIILTCEPKQYLKYAIKAIHNLDLEKPLPDYFKGDHKFESNKVCVGITYKYNVKQRLSTIGIKK